MRIRIPWKKELTSLLKAGRQLTRGTILKIVITVFISLSCLILLESRGHPFAYFSTRCRDYDQDDYSRKLNDRLADYVAAARNSGVSPSENDDEFRKKISDGKLVKVSSGSLYIIDRMYYSYPFVTPEGKELLDDIAMQFQAKCSGKGLPGARFYLTSMTRKTDDLKNLRRMNSNSSANSPHLYGNAFDISYKRFSAHKLFLTNCDKKFLKEALAEVISRLKDENKCWATYEKMQNCFHVVARKN
jgi:hypothetical protein